MYLLTAYKCRCTRKGPKIRYKDVQKLEIKPKHPFCQEKMILWVTLLLFLSFCCSVSLFSLSHDLFLFSYSFLLYLFFPSPSLCWLTLHVTLSQYLYLLGSQINDRVTIKILGRRADVIKTSCRLSFKHSGGFTAWWLTDDLMTPCGLREGWFIRWREKKHHFSRTFKHFLHDSLIKGWLSLIYRHLWQIIIQLRPCYTCVHHLYYIISYK